MSHVPSPGGDGKNKNQIIGKIRIGSLNKLFAYRYGGCPSACDWQFSDDDAGLEDLKILLHHYRFTFAHKMLQIIKLRAPWADADKILEEIYAYPRKWKFERLGQILNFTGKEWRQLRIRIAPVDMSAEERRDYSRNLSNWKRRKKRRSKGMKTRAEYLETNNLSRTEPWKAEGISKRTWYRRRGTSLAGIHKNAHDRPVSQGWSGHEDKNTKEWVVEYGSSPTQLSATPDQCPFFIPDRIPGAPDLIPYGRLVSLAEIRQAMGYRH
jgi:hypothetical protein